MTPEQAVWVRLHAWPERLAETAARAIAHPELAAKDYGCVCQLGPCGPCQRGWHDTCRGTGSKVPVTSLLGSDGWAVRYAEGRHVFVWLADRTCRAMCPCDCRQTAQERGLLFDLTTA